MKPLTLLHASAGALVLTTALAATDAHAFLYLSGSVSASTSNVPFQTYESRYGSGSIGIDLGRFVRLQFTHSQEISASTGFKDPDSDDQAADATDGDETTVADTCSDCIATASQTHMIGNSVDLQVILYEGKVIVPYIMAGGIVKTYKFETKEEGKDDTLKEGTVGPVPNLGAGIGLRLNREFTLKLTYLASPGLTQTKGDPEPRGIWDKKVTLGLTYQL